MFKYIAKQIEPGSEDFGYVFDDDGLNPSGGDENYTLFIFYGNDCRYNDDIYSDYKYAIDSLLSDLYDYFNDGYMEDISDDSFANHLDYVAEIGFNIDSETIQLLDYCVKCADENDYPEALAAYLEAKSGKPWDTKSFNGYVQGDYCTLVYCKDFYDDTAINYYGNMWLGCGGEFALGELEVPDEEDYTIDLSDLDSFEHLVKDWIYGCFVIDDIIWRGGDRLISEISDCFDCSREDLEVYVYENGEYINTKDQ